MKCKIEILFSVENIKKYIKNYDNLVVGEESFKIYHCYDHGISKGLNICIDSQEKIKTLEKLFDFFIEHKCFFFIEKYCDLFEIDKDLFYKSGYWFTNSKKYWKSHYNITSNYLALTYNDNISVFINNTIDNFDFDFDDIDIRIDYDLNVMDFILEKCKSELSDKKFKSFTYKFVQMMCRKLTKTMEKYGVNFFRGMRKNNILDLFINYAHNNNWVHSIVMFSIETNQTEIIDYLLKYGLCLNNVEIYRCNDYKILISLIKEDYMETFTYTIENIRVCNDIIRIIIEYSGEFITKEYIEILLNNNKLNLVNLISLKKSTKKNPDTKLKKYVKELLLEEKKIIIKELKEYIDILSNDKLDLDDLALINKTLNKIPLKKE